MARTKKTTRTKKMMNKENYDLIKLMYAKMGNEASLKNMADITGYGMATISRVKATNSFAEYIEYQKAYRTRKSPPEITKPEPKAVAQEPTKTNDLDSTDMLVRIAVALEKIADYMVQEKEINEMAESYIKETTSPSVHSRAFWSKK